MAESEIYEVERILARRRTRKGKLEYMVRWKNFDSDEDTWEPLENLGDCMELVEDFNRRTLKEGKFDKLASLDTNKKKLNGGKKKPGDVVKEKSGPVKEVAINGKERLGNGKNTVIHGKDKIGSGKEKSGNGKEKLGNGKEKLAHGKVAASPHSKDKHNKVGNNANSNSRTRNDIEVGKTADGAVKAQKRKRESDVNTSKQMNGPMSASSSTSSRADTVAAEKRMKRAHSVTGVVAKDSSTSSNGMSPTLFRRRLNSTVSSEALNLSLNSSPMSSQHRAMSASPYPKLVLSPSRMGLPTRKGTSTILTNSFPSAAANDKEPQGRRTASIVARRRLSQSSPGSEENTMDSRRFSARQTESLHKFKEIVVKKCPGYTQIRLFTTTPTRNALNLKALQELTNVLEASQKDDSKVIFLSGSGSVFCSGLDLRYLQTSLVEERKRAAKNLSDAVRNFIDSLINCPKIVVVAVNGPAIGLGAAILPLCDIAYASDKAYFHLPYSILSQTPEGCASHTFPQVLGLALAGEMLYAGRKLTALEACACGLVSHTFWPTSFMQEVIPRVQRIAAQSGKALLQSKLLLRGQMRAKLEYVNECECAALEERWRSIECYRQIKLFAENYSDM